MNGFSNRIEQRGVKRHERTDCADGDEPEVLGRVGQRVRRGGGEEDTGQGGGEEGSEEGREEIGEEGPEEEVSGPAREAHAGERRACLAAVVAVACLFGTYGFVRSPVPGVNEPHYLSKARHVWDPQWCGRDLFLNSANAHAVFLWVFGAPAAVLPLETLAVAGRVIVWLCLAVGWLRLGSVLLRDPLASVAAAGIFLGLSAAGSLSGEWIIGGVEAKGFAWAALWLAIADLLQGRRLWAGLWAGVSVSSHPVVGMWGSLACLGAGLFANHRVFTSLSEKWSYSVWLLAALPGLVPAILMLASADPELTAEANRIQVIIRLGHHLDPRQFPPSSWILTGIELLVLAVALGWLFRRSDPAWRTFTGILTTAVVIALAGLAIGFGPRWYGLMKFYPFRLLDGLLPLAAGFALVAVAQTIAARGVRWAAVVGTLAFVAALLLPSQDRRPPAFTGAELRDWKAMGRWISQATPRDALFVTPRYSYAFKWYANRAEYVSNKDMPQDAASLVEWQRRREWMSAFRARAWYSGYARPYLNELHETTGAEYLVAAKNVVRSRKPVYANEHFAVYALASDRTCAFERASRPRDAATGTHGWFSDEPADPPAEGRSGSSQVSVSALANQVSTLGASEARMFPLAIQDSTLESSMGAPRGFVFGRRSQNQAPAARTSPADPRNHGSVQSILGPTAPPGASFPRPVCRILPIRSGAERFFWKAT
jgi:hypothetical protein